MNDKIEILKEIVLKYCGNIMSKDVRADLCYRMQDVLPGSRLTDITTSDELDCLSMTFGVEMPNGRNAMIMVDTSNGMSSKDEIKITIL